jgi:hypothetical protein
VLAQAFKLGQEFTVLFGEDFFEFFPDVACEGGAFAFCADSYLQISAFDDGGNVKVAKLGRIDDVAENLKLLAILVYLVIEPVIICGCYNERRLGEIILSVFTLN